MWEILEARRLNPTHPFGSSSSEGESPLKPFYHLLLLEADVIFGQPDMIFNSSKGHSSKEPYSSAELHNSCYEFVKANGRGT